MLIGAVTWLMLGVVGAWFAWCLRRFQVYWDTGDARITELGAALRKVQRDLAEDQRSQEKLAHEIKAMDRQAEKSRADERELRQRRKDAAPPPPIEIMVTSEFPSSASETPWIAQLVRRFSPAAHAAPVRPILFWAAGHQTAMARAQHFAGELQFAVNDIRRFSPAD